MEKLTRSELRIFELLRKGKTKEEILSSKVTTASNLSYILSQIYRKTEDIVHYHSAKDKYGELLCYLRNHPDEFSIIPFNESRKKQKQTEMPKTKTKQECPYNLIQNAINNLGFKYTRLINNTTQKMSMLDELSKDLLKEIENAG